MYLSFVLFYQAIGSAEGQYIVDVRPTEGINALRIVAHYADPVVSCSQLAYDGVLGQVGVLVLVHQDVVEVGTVFLEHVRMVAEQQEGVEQQVIEVHGSRLAATVPILLVDIAHGGDAGGLVGFVGFAAVGIRGGCHQVVLGVGDA